MQHTNDKEFDATKGAESLRLHLSPEGLATRVPPVDLPNKGGESRGQVFALAKASLDRRLPPIEPRLQELQPICWAKPRVTIRIRLTTGTGILMNRNCERQTAACSSACSLAYLAVAVK